MFTREQVPTCQMELELCPFLASSCLDLLAIWPVLGLESTDSYCYLKATEENTGVEPLGVTFQPSMT